MIVLHHLNNSRSQRILWLLEELGLEYEVKRYERDPVTMLAPKELRAIHPLGKSPVITDEGQTFAESGAIVEYLTAKYGGGRLVPPEGSPEKLRYTYWLHYAEGSAMPPLLLSLIFAKMPDSPMPIFVRPVLRPILKAIGQKVRSSFLEPQLRLHFDYLESELSKRTWFAGTEFTAADIQMSFPVEAGALRVKGHRPKLKEFLARIHARPAYQRALERGGTYEIIS